MADTKKSIINRGKRIYNLRPGPEGRARVLEPGKSVECIDEAEFKQLSNYHDLTDVDKIAPQVAKRVEDLQAQLAKAQAENDKLKAQQAAVPEPVTVPDDQSDSKKPEKKKGR